VLLIMLGAWGGLIPFVGPYFHYAYTPDSAWTFTANRLWLEVLPGVATMLGGLVVTLTSSRAAAQLGSWLAGLSGAWFAIGSVIGRVWSPSQLSAGTPVGGNLTRALEQIGFFTGLGLVIVLLAALTLGRASVVGVREARAAAAKPVRVPALDERCVVLSRPLRRGPTGMAHGLTRGEQRRDLRYRSAAICVRSHATLVPSGSHRTAAPDGQNDDQAQDPQQAACFARAAGPGSGIAPQAARQGFLPAPLVPSSHHPGHPCRSKRPAGTPPRLVRGRKLANRGGHRTALHRGPLMARIFGGSLLGRLAGLATAVAAVIALLIVLAAVHLLPQLRNPFATTTTQRSGPVLLKSITALSRYEAASGTFQVVIELSSHTAFIPSFIAGTDTLFIGQGTEIAYVNFAGLTGKAIGLSANGTAVKVSRPPAQPEPAVCCSPPSAARGSCSTACSTRWASGR
jgi:hypothetical protein